MLPEKEEWIKENRYLDELRNLYKEKKNRNKALNQKSRSLYAEVVHEICQKHSFGK